MVRKTHPTTGIQGLYLIKDSDIGGEISPNPILDSLGVFWEDGIAHFPLPDTANVFLEALGIRLRILLDLDESAPQAIFLKSLGYDRQIVSLKDYFHDFIDHLQGFAIIASVPLAGTGQPMWPEVTGYLKKMSDLISKLPVLSESKSSAQAAEDLMAATLEDFSTRLSAGPAERDQLLMEFAAIIRKQIEDFDRHAATWNFQRSPR